MHFHETVSKTTRALDRVLRRYPGARPEVVAVQRRYPSQRSEPRVDAALRTDPRTAIVIRHRAGERSVLPQPQWLIAAYDALKHRRANLQLQIGAVFPYGSRSVTRTIKIIDAIAEVWLACEPVVRVFGPKSKPKKVKSRKKA